MSRTVELIYHDGVFRPVGPVELPEDTQITLTIPEANGSPPDPATQEDEPAWWRGVMPVEFEEKVVSRIVVEIPKDAPRLEPEPSLDPRWFDSVAADSPR